MSHLFPCFFKGNPALPHQFYSNMTCTHSALSQDVERHSLFAVILLRHFNSLSVVLVLKFTKITDFAPVNVQIRLVQSLAQIWRSTCVKQSLLFCYNTNTITHIHVQISACTHACTHIPTGQSQKSPWTHTHTHTQMRAIGKKYAVAH